MAQTIHCDGQDHQDAPADILVSQTANGETSAWCVDHFAQFCRAIADNYDAAVAENQAAEAAAVARLEGAEPVAGDTGGPDDEPADDDEPEATPGAPGVAGDPPGDQLSEAGLGDQATLPGEPAAEPVIAG